MESLDLFKGIMKPYLERVADVKNHFNMTSHNLINHENEIQNDHIAFRTLGSKNLGIKSLEKYFFILVILKGIF